MGSIARFGLTAIMEKHGLRHFIGVGAGDGESLAHASRFGFKSLATSETDHTRYVKLKTQFEPDTRTCIAHDDPVHFLQEALFTTPTDEPVLIWFDDPLAVDLPICLGTIRANRPGHDVIIVDDLRVFTDGPFEHGNVPANLRPQCPENRDPSLFSAIIGRTHDVYFDFAHEGYAVMVPKQPVSPDAPPPTLLGPDTLNTLLGYATRSPPGDFVEVGVYRGGVAWHLSRIAKQRGDTDLHLFDTFTGIPERGPEDDTHHIGDFSDTSLEVVKTAVPDAIYHVGVFPESFTGKEEYFPSIAFVHVDCDQYRCACAVIDIFAPMLAPGGVMLFDDYNATGGVRLAVDQKLTGRTDGELGFTPQGKAVFIKSAASGQDGAQTPALNSACGSERGPGRIGAQEGEADV